jgi:hypothetical protein
MLDTRTAAAAEHVMQHEPRGSYLDRKARRDARKSKAWTNPIEKPQARRGGRS